MNLTYGKLPASPSNAPKLSDLFNIGKLPELPAGDFGHEEGITFPNLGNDYAGDCVWAGGSSEELVWSHEMGRRITVNAASAIRNYTECTGYNPNAPLVNGVNPTDRGTDMGVAAEFRKTKGLWDANDHRHLISDYVQLEPGNIEQLWYAMWIFDGVGLGWNFFQQWEDELQSGSRVLGQVTDLTSAGGHYTPGFGRRNGNISTPSWQMLLQVTPAGYEQSNDETFAYMTKEKLLPTGETLTGLDYAQWRAEFALVHGLTFAQTHDLTSKN